MFDYTRDIDLYLNVYKNYFYFQHFHFMKTPYQQLEQVEK